MERRKAMNTRSTGERTKSGQRSKHHNLFGEGTCARGHHMTRVIALECATKISSHLTSQGHAREQVRCMDGAWAHGAHSTSNCTAMMRGFLHPSWQGWQKEGRPEEVVRCDGQGPQPKQMAIARLSIKVYVNTAPPPPPSPPHAWLWSG